MSRKLPLSCAQDFAKIHNGFAVCILVIISAFNYSCNKAVLKNASVEATRPPIIYGNNRALKAGDHQSVSVEFTRNNYDINTSLQGHSKLEDDPEFSADYRLRGNTWGLQFNIVTVRESGFHSGAGIGAQGFPYVFLSMGLNKEYFELGSAALLGFPSLKIDYEGYYENDDGEISGGFSGSESFGSISAYLYTSIYFNRFALNYVVSYTTQSRNFTFSEGDCTGCEISVFLKTPDLYIHDIGIVYVNNHIKYRIGLNQIRSYELPRNYWGTSFQAAWLW